MGVYFLWQDRDLHVEKEMMIRPGGNEWSWELVIRTFLIYIY